MQIGNRNHENLLNYINCISTEANVLYSIETCAGELYSTSNMQAILVLQICIS